MQIRPDLGKKLIRAHPSLITLTAAGGLLDDETVAALSDLRHLHLDCLFNANKFVLPASLAQTQLRQLRITFGTAGVRTALQLKHLKRLELEFAELSAADWCNLSLPALKHAKVSGDTPINVIAASAPNLIELNRQEINREQALDDFSSLSQRFPDGSCLLPRLQKLHHTFRRKSIVGAAKRKAFTDVRPEIAFTYRS